MVYTCRKAVLFGAIIYLVARACFVSQVSCTRNCEYNGRPIGTRFNMVHVPVVLPLTFHCGTNLCITRGSVNDSERERERESRKEKHWITRNSFFLCNVRNRIFRGYPNYLFFFFAILTNAKCPK